MAQMFTIENEISINMEEIVYVFSPDYRKYGSIHLKDGSNIECNHSICKELINSSHYKNIQHKKDCGIDSLQTI